MMGLSLASAQTRFDIERVHAHSLDILHNHKPSPLPAATVDKLASIITAADQQLTI
jgi:hypothetical protein